MSDKKNKNLKLEILEKLATLTTAGFGLVAALAWNSAIQDLFKQVNVFGQPDSLLAKFVYAFAITVMVVLVTYAIGRSVNRAKGELGPDADEPEDEKQ